MVSEFVLAGIIQRAERRGEPVDMTRRHRGVGERVFERTKTITGVTTSLGSLAVFSRATAVVSEDISWTPATSAR